MQFPLELSLQPSRAVKASVLVVYLATALALFHVIDGDALAANANPAWGGRVLFAGCCAFLLLAALRAWRAEAGKCGALLLGADGVLVMFERDAEQGLPCRVEPASAVDLGWALWFRVLPLEHVQPMPPLAARSRRMMLVPHNLAGDDWRMLRIWLRHKALHRADAEVLPSP
ncbi:MAG: protein YgfX [Thauera sp.]